MSKPLNLNQAWTQSQETIELSPDVRKRMQDSVDFLKRYLEAAEAPVYGVNTGFGSLQSVRVPDDQLSELQRNLLITHAAGTGEVLSRDLRRLMIYLKLQNMSQGYSALRPIVFERLAAMLNQDCLPRVTQQGSLGASGDLAPLAQMVLPLIGEGQLESADGKWLSGAEWLQSNAWEPLLLMPKEALALINGTQFMLSHAVLTHQRIERIGAQLPLISALSADAFDCRPEPFEAPLHRIRPHHGQVHVAQQMRELLAQSPMAALPKKQVQDPYSFRCIPQVHGASWDALNHCFSVWETELNAVTDNPNVFEDENRVLSGGNFHGQPLALTLDYAAMALAEWANISERRTYLLIGGQRGLKPYLADDPGLDSGYMIAQYSAAALVSQNKQLCTPASVDSIVSSNGQEDHVSMGANAATKLLRVVDNVERVLAIEWLTACKAMGQRKAYNQSQGLTYQSNPELEAKWAEFEGLLPGTHQDIPMETLIELSRSYLFG